MLLESFGTDEWVRLGHGRCSKEYTYNISVFLRESSSSLTRPPLPRVADRPAAFRYAGTPPFHAHISQKSIADGFLGAPATTFIAPAWRYCGLGELRLRLPVFSPGREYAAA